MRPAIFLDRDGVILVNRSDYVKSWEEVCFLPNAFEGLRRLADSGWPLVLVTNQSAVGRGILSLELAQTINARVVAEVHKQGGRLDAVYLCPHHPRDGCACRKPSPGMLRQAASELDLDLPASYLIGDALSDLAAAQAVGAQGILVLTGRGTQQAQELSKEEAASIPVVPDLNAAADYILARIAVEGIAAR